MGSSVLLDAGERGGFLPLSAGKPFPLALRRKLTDPSVSWVSVFLLLVAFLGTRLWWSVGAWLQ